MVTSAPHEMAVTVMPARHERSVYESATYKYWPSYAMAVGCCSWQGELRVPWLGVQDRPGVAQPTSHCTAF